MGAGSLPSNACARAAASAVPRDATVQGWGALLKGGNGLRSITLAGGVALHATNVYVATTILPSVVGDIGGIDLYAWNTSLFVAASIVGSALSAKLLDALGPRRAYVAAALVFATGSAICGLAPLMWIMLAGRFVQGLGGGLLFALAYAMIRLVFDEVLWPRAMALVSGMWGVATLLGPAIGGLFAELDAWRAAFFFLIPITAVFAVLAALVLPAARVDRRSDLSLPVAQLLLLFGAVLAVSAGSVPTSVAWNAVGLTAGLLLLLLLVTVERGASARLLPRGAFSLRHLLGPLYALMSLLAITVTASEIFIPLFLQTLHRQTPLVAGYLAALMAAGWTLGSIAGASVRDRGLTLANLLSPVLALTGMLALAALVPAGSGGSWMALAPICLALLVVGLGVGLAWPHLLTRVVQVGRGAEQELASASITTVQLSATALGAALAGMVANAAGLTDPGGVTGTAKAAAWLFGCFASAPLVGIVLTIGILRSQRSALGRVAPTVGA